MHRTKNHAHLLSSSRRRQLIRTRRDPVHAFAVKVRTSRYPCLSSFSEYLMDTVPHPVGALCLHQGNGSAQHCPFYLDRKNPSRSWRPPPIRRRIADASGPIDIGSAKAWVSAGCVCVCFFAFSHLVLTRTAGGALFIIDLLMSDTERYLYLAF